MNEDDLVRTFFDFLAKVAGKKVEIPLNLQKQLLAGLAVSGNFAEPAGTLLFLSAETVGDHDEWIPEMVKTYHRQRWAAEESST